ncbi:E3 ubiquitin-protein ligase [Tetrabaena socialis]|uniref:E3 ubiquitin-protein ligase n=1 Tax=Tetrabaena socialis TaxID=47790 RepID=A0A2J7ZW82_9CHLO|nr:E3 ubiquitin-protein ligase [Tetrabaena socialis]|eukprot:PNH04533.1 E3 ubiquitin-protein ligase [Tetrabaena socialis]
MVNFRPPLEPEPEPEDNAVNAGTQTSAVNQSAATQTGPAAVAQAQAVQANAPQLEAGTQTSESPVPTATLSSQTLVQRARPAGDDAAINHLLAMPHADQRRAACAVPKAQLLAQVHALSGCQRCGFVEQVLAAFDPELAVRAASDAGYGSAAEVPVGEGPGAPGAGGEAAAARTALPAAILGGSSTAGPLAPAQLLSLLSCSGGSDDLVGLLQFAWKPPGLGGSGADGGASGTGASSSGAGTGSGGGSRGGAISLSDTLLGKPQLLRRFLKESVGVMQRMDYRTCDDLITQKGSPLCRWLRQALADDVGDCRRHGSYPGPAELASTLARLQLQRSHTLERLAAWGVLRAPPQPPPPQQQAQVPPQQQQCQARCEAPPEAGQRQHPQAGEGAAAGEAEEEDAQLALAIRLSLQEVGLSSGAPGVAAPAGRPNGGASPGVLQGQEQRQAAQLAVAGVALSLQQQGQQQGTPAALLQRRLPRTPPRPTGSSGAGACSGLHCARSGQPSPPGPARGLGTWPGPSPGRSPGVAAAGARRLRSTEVASSLEGLAACGLADEPTARQPLIQPPGQSALSGPEPEQPGGTEQPAAAAPPTPPCRPSPVRGTVAAAPPPAGRPLPVAAAVAAAEGLADATVLVDGAAVAALPAGLQERVAHLVQQLAQVQQRRGRLEHACQHGIIAAGRKLLLILLQLLWAALRRAATEAAAGAGVGASGASLPGAPRAGALRLQGRVGAGAPAPGEGDAAGALASTTPTTAATMTATSTPYRVPRYEGLLAELASGLGEDDTHLDLDLGLGLYDLDPDLDGGDPLGETLSEVSFGEEGEPGGGGASWGEDEPEGRGAGGAGERRGSGWDPARGSVMASSPPALSRPPRGSGGSGRALDVNVGWDAARVSYVPRHQQQQLRLSLSASLRQSSAPAPPPPPLQGAATLPRAARRAASVALPPAPSGAANDSAAATQLLRGSFAVSGGPAAVEGGSGGGGAQPDRGWASRWRRLQEGEEGAAEGEGQLARCQASQAELQGEVGRLLGMLADSRRTHERASLQVREELSRWQAEAAALSGLGPEELAALAARMEAALSRVRAAQLQAASERDLMCPVCWEARKALVFGCGHQTCCACGDKLAACPICRLPVSLRIRVYS